MAFIPVPNAAKVIIFGHTGEREWSFSLWFTKAGFTSPDLETLLDGVEAWIDSHLQNDMVDQANFDQLVAYDMRAVDGEKLVREIDYPGLHSDTPLAVNSALVVSFYGAKRGKWNQGRVFCPGLAEDQVNEYRVADATAEFFRTDFQDLIDNPFGGWIWCIASRYFNGAPRVAGVVSNVISVVIRNGVVGTQKRRLRKT